MPAISLSDAVDEANGFARRELTLLAPVALALIVLPAVVIGWLGGGPGQAIAGTTQAMRFDGALNPVGLLATLYASLVVSLLVLRPGISVGEAFRAGLRRMAVAIGASLLLGVAFALLIAPTLPLMMGGEAAVQRMNPAFALLLLLYLVAVVAALVFVLVRLLLLNTVVAAEPLGVFATIARAWELTRGLFWRLFGLIVLFLIASLIASLAVVAAGGTVLLAIGRLAGDLALGRLLLEILSAGVNAAFVTWLYVALACIYRQRTSAPSSGI